MTRDYAQFVDLVGSGDMIKREHSLLERLGWKPFFQQQVDIDNHAGMIPVRVIEVHRSGMHVLGEHLDTLIPNAFEATVGDWILYDSELPTHSIVLERSSFFERRAPGRGREKQMIAANVDTVFIVSSCNKDFNIARLERYVALAFEARVTPVILLTKADLCDDTSVYFEAASAISDRVLVNVLNALNAESLAKLSPWCKLGQTLAFLGSSGVGKSTLVNMLFGYCVADTAAIREDDSKGRHTTTRRQLHFTDEGCAVIDTPGMRELQLTDVEAGIAEVFDDLVRLEAQCRFRDCKHDTEPDCAIRSALDNGEIDQVRLSRWVKLAAEERFNTSNLIERKAFDKSRHKMHKSIQQKKKW